MIIISIQEVFKKEPEIPKSLMGKRFTDFDGDRWELTGKNKLNVPYFSKVVRGRTQKKQFTHVSGYEQIKKWKKQQKKVKSLQAKRIKKQLKTTFKYKGMKLKNIKRTGKQKDGNYIYEGLIIPQGIGVPRTLKAKNLDGYFRKVKQAYNKKWG